jgi:hypothetical protein
VSILFQRSWALWLLGYPYGGVRHARSEGGEGAAGGVGGVTVCLMNAHHGQGCGARPVQWMQPERNGETTNGPRSVSTNNGALLLLQSATRTSDRNLFGSVALTNTSVEVVDSALKSALSLFHLEPDWRQSRQDAESRLKMTGARKLPNTPNWRGGTSGLLVPAFPVMELKR